MNSTRGKILAIDHGSKRIGVALSDETNTIAFGKEVIDNNSKCIDNIVDIVNSNNVAEIILGYPLNLRGERTKQTFEVESFEKMLINKFTGSPVHQITIIRWDERLTSKMAKSSMLESGMKEKNRRIKSNLDIISATILLQSYLDSKKRPTNNE